MSRTCYNTDGQITGKDNNTKLNLNNIQIQNRVSVAHHLCAYEVSFSKRINGKFPNSFISGPRGFRGSRGITGATGPDGFLGVSGATGFTGIDGPTGIIGNTGNGGVVGITGIGGTGVVGSVGITGPTGVSGIQGLQGGLGPTGPQGLQGFDGIVGVIGPDGSVGLQGVDGAVGTTGVDGNTGLQGFDGDIGQTGITGFSPMGFDGDFGPSGVSGPTGATGVTGIGFGDYAWGSQNSDDTALPGDILDLADTASINSANLTFTNLNRDLTINAAGSYFITFSAYANADYQIKATLNGTDIPGAQFATSGNSRVNGQFIVAAVPGDVIELVNAGAVNMTSLTPPQPGSNNASFVNITAIRLTQ